MSKILQYQEEVLKKFEDKIVTKSLPNGYREILGEEVDIQTIFYLKDCLTSALQGQLKVVDEMIEDDKIKIDSKVKLPDDIKNRIIISNKALSNIQSLLQNK